MKNISSFYIVFQVLRELHSHQRAHHSHQIYYFLLFYISFYISRHHFPQILKKLHLSLSEKRFSSQIFLSERIQLSPPTPNGQNRRTFFVDAPLASKYDTNQKQKNVRPFLEKRLFSKTYYISFNHS